MLLKLNKVLATGGLFFILAAACVCTRTPDKKPDGALPIDPVISEISKSFVLSDEEIKKDLGVLTAYPHPLGSERNLVVAEHLLARVQPLSTFKQEFTAAVPNPAALNNPGAPIASTLERKGQNLIATGVLKPEADCIVLIGSHYDTKDIPGISYVGANDSGSSSAALIHITNFLHEQKDKTSALCDVGAIWFDGEEALLKDWHDGIRKHPAKIQDNTYGSRHFVSTLVPCTKLDRSMKCMPENLGGKAVVALVLMDMIGSPDIQISRDTNSSVSLLRALEQAAAVLEVPWVINPQSASIEDDHIPFRRAQIAALDIIDFNNTVYWHKTGDDFEKLSIKSIELASKLAIFTTLSAASESKVFAETSE